MTILLLIGCCIPSYADGNGIASRDFSFHIPSYFRIETVTSPVLIANITDRTGNLPTNLGTQFKVISNNHEAKKLYLNAVINTDSGQMDSMFEQGGRVYVAFGNLQKPPKANALMNCKIGSMPNQSPGVVAYPVLSVRGTSAKFNRGEGKYEVYAKNGITNVSVNIGSHVLQNSFAANDPNGSYQAILSLTEADM